MGKIVDRILGQSSRGWGLTVDTIVGLDVVLANGSLVHANSTAYTDIFWVSLALHANMSPIDIHRLSGAQRIGNHIHDPKFRC